MNGMQDGELDRTLSEHGHVLKEVRFLLRSAVALLVILALVSISGAVAALRTYQEGIAPTVEEARAALADIRVVSAEVSALLTEAKQAVGEARRAAGAVAPVVEEAGRTIREAEATTEEAQRALAPFEVLKVIPVVNWFF